MTDEEIIAIVREASKGSAIRRDGTTTQRIARAIEAKVIERCAEVCDGLERKKWLTVMNGGELSGIGAKDCASAIRAMKQPK